MRTWCLTAAVILLAATPVQADAKKVATFNAESSADTHWFEVAKTIRAAGKVDVWALQEVESRATAARYTEAAAAWGRHSYRYVISESGEIRSPHRSNDFLAVIYNSSELRHLETVELHVIRSEPNGNRLGKAAWRLRGALFARLYDYSSGTEFYVGNVHLKCCEEGQEIRSHQARLLMEWIRRIDVPVILVGDFNIPVKPDSEDGNQSSGAFRTLVRTMHWLRPSNPTKTQCDPKYDSMLDHVFLKSEGNVRTESVDILQPTGAYCDAERIGGSDHRPVVASFSFAQPQ